MSAASTNPATARDKQTGVSLVDLEEQVRRRAYELYEGRGKENGHELEDWLQAESELVPQRANSAAG